MKSSSEGKGTKANFSFSAAMAFELYSEDKHGPNEWAKPADIDETGEAEALVEASVSFERDLEGHLVYNLEMIEPGIR